MSRLLTNSLKGYTKKDPPLDTYDSNAIMLYGFKKLVSSYDGPLARLRKDSTDEERDVYEEDLKSGSRAAAFFGASMGYVVKIYDQSASGNDITANSGAEANQALIFLNGRYLRDSHHNVAMYANGSSTRYTLSYTSARNPQNMAILMKIRTLGNDTTTIKRCCSARITASNRGYYVGPDYGVGSNKWKLQVGNGTSTYNTVASNELCNKNEVMLYAHTTSSAQVLRINNSTYTGANTFVVNNSQTTDIFSSLSAQHYKGLMTFFAFFNTTFTSTQRDDMVSKCAHYFNTPL